MGMIFFLYTYSSYSSYSFHTITISAGFPAPCLFLYSLSSNIFPAGFYSAFRQSFSYPVFVRSIRFRSSPPSFRFPSCHVAGISLLSVYRLVGRAVGVPFRFVPLFVSFVSARRNGAPFFVSSFSRAVIVSPWCSFPRGGVVSSVLSVVSLWRCGFAVCSFRRLARRLVVRSGFLSSRRSSRVLRLVWRLVFIVVFALSSALALSVIAHRAMASPSYLVVGIGMGVSC